MSTHRKIAAFLDICPMTYQQLQKASEIHRNSLRTGLDDLERSGILIKHRLAFPKNDFCLGSGETGKVYDTPQFRSHYLLNVFHYEANVLLHNYYKPDENYSTYRKLSPENNEASGLIKRPKSMTDEFHLNVNKYVEFTKRTRQLEFGLTLDSIRPKIELRFTGDDGYSQRVSEYAKQTIRSGFSLADLIIRVCNAPILSSSSPTEKKYILLPMFRYEEILHLLTITGFRKELEAIFNDNLKTSIPQVPNQSTG